MSFLDWLAVGQFSKDLEISLVVGINIPTLQLGAAGGDEIYRSPGLWFEVVAIDGNEIFWTRTRGVDDDVRT